MMHDDILKIITAGTFAPSGENCQPWRFRVVGNTIEVYLLPERDNSLYGWGHRASFVAHGALLENMEIAAAHVGYQSSIQLFPNLQEKNLVAKIQIQPQSRREAHPLYHSIFERVTNRRHYHTQNTSPEEQKTLFAAGMGISEARVLCMYDSERINILAKSGSTGERILFQNKKLHSFFFSHLNWTKEEDRKKSIGFFIDTLELPPPARLMFRLFRRWSILNIMNRCFGVSRLIAGENAKIYASAPTVGVILIPDTRPESYIHAGRLLERVWLTATMRGLSFQPIAGLLFLIRRIEAGETEHFSDAEIKQAQSAYSEIKRIFGVSSEIPVMMFRIGKSDPPSARASRLTPDIMWQ